MADDPPASNETPPPRVWLVLGEKRGDNAQVRNLARAVDVPALEKTMRMKPEWVEGKPPVAASLDHLDLDRSDPIEGPWPDLVITAGRRLASVALHIKRASGGRTRVVVIGKPRGRIADFDLVVVASHYVVPDATNIVRHALPLMRVDRDALAEWKKAWVGRLLLLPRPLTGLLVGGATGGLRFDVDTAKRLLEESRAAVDKQRGSLYIATSRRTPPEVAAYLRHAKTPNEQLYLYDEASPPDENPYQGLLALADHFVVTTDSLSMMVEVADLGRPLSLFPLEREASGLEGLLNRLGLMKRLSPKTEAIPAGGVAARILAALGWPIHSRDLSAISRWLVAQGRANWLGDSIVQPEAVAASLGVPDPGMAEVVSRIRALLD